MSSANLGDVVRTTMTSWCEESHSFLFHPLEYPPETTVSQTLTKINQVKQRQIETSAQILEQKRRFEHAIAMTDNDKALITQLELLRSDLDDDLVELQSFLGPWRPSRIPVEILWSIFAYASHSYAICFLWDLMAVCRAWRRAVIGCTALWSSLSIVHHERSKNTMNDRCWRVNYKSQVLQTPVAVQKALRRSRGGPLEVSLVVSTNRNADFCRDCFARCLAMIGRRCEQFRFLRLNIQTGYLGVNIGPMLSGSLSNLRLVRIASYSPDLVAALASRAPHLHTVEFTGFSLQRFAPYIGKAFWPRIRKLDLGFAWNKQLHDLSHLLAACTALHSLWINDRSCGGVSGPKPILKLWPPDMPNLTSMRCILRLPAWTLLSSMRITLLYIRSPMARAYNTRGMSRIYLPNLEHLTCSGSPTTLCAVGLFDAPSIIDLVIIGLSALSIAASRDLNDVWGNVSIRPRNVSLHWRPSPTNSDLEYFQPLLDSLREIQCLTLRGIPLGDTEMFTQTRRQRLCPNLERITWWLVDDVDDTWSRDRFYEAACDCFGGPQTHWTVEWISRAEDDRTFFLPIHLGDNMDIPAY